MTTFFAVLAFVEFFGLAMIVSRFATERKQRLIADATSYCLMRVLIQHGLKVRITEGPEVTEDPGFPLDQYHGAPQ